MKFDKLIRDKIPELISLNGENAVTRTLSSEEFLEALKAKLSEEIEEFNGEHDVTELADILEVVYAIASEMGVSETELEKVRQSKLDERGSFSRRLMLVETRKPGP